MERLLKWNFIPLLLVTYKSREGSIRKDIEYLNNTINKLDTMEVWSYVCVYIVGYIYIYVYICVCVCDTHTYLLVSNNSYWSTYMATRKSLLNQYYSNILKYIYICICIFYIYFFTNKLYLYLYSNILKDQYYADHLLWP